MHRFVRSFVELRDWARSKSTIYIFLRSGDISLYTDNIFVSTVFNTRIGDEAKIDRDGKGEQAHKCSRIHGKYVRSEKFILDDYDKIILLFGVVSNLLFIIFLVWQLRRAVS